MKVKYILIMVAICANMVSCKSKDGESNTQVSVKDIAYNEKIQDTFFGVPFGSTGEEVEAGFKKTGLYINSNSTASTLFFNPYGADSKFSFGGLTWDYLRAQFSGDGIRNGGKFYSIQFCSAYKTKEAALSDFNSVMNALSNKYALTKKNPTDTSTYKIYVGQTRNNQVIYVVCCSYESYGHERWIGVELGYTDNNYNKVSDEL
jgi:hypothetical protein